MIWAFLIGAVCGCGVSMLVYVAFILWVGQEMEKDDRKGW